MFNNNFAASAVATVDLEQLSKAVQGNLELRIGGEYEIVPYTILKRGDREFHGFSFRKKGWESVVAPTIYLMPNLSAEENVEAILDALSKVEANAEEMAENNAVVADAPDWASVKSLVRPRFISTADNQRYKETVVSADISGGITAIFAVELSLMMSTIVTPGHLKSLGITKEQLLEAALSNIGAVQPGRDIAEILSEFKLMSEAQIEELQDQAPMQVLGTGFPSGATRHLLDISVIRKTAEKAGDDLFIIPSSTEELIVVPQMGGDVKTILQMVSEVNASQVSPEMRLSDCVFTFTRGEQGLRLVTPDLQVSAFNPVKELRAAFKAA